MGYTFKAFVVLFALIFLHIIIMCSVISFHHERRTLPSQSRRLLVSVNSVPSAALNKLKGAVKEPVRSVEASLRKRPPSASNPTQN